MEKTKHYTYFPPQKLSTKQKTKEWFQENVQAAQRLVFMNNSGDLELKKKMQIWHDIYRDIIDEEQIHDVLNPLQIDSGVFPATLKNYPLTIPKIDLLVGEEIKRRFDWSVVSRNEDAHSNYASNLMEDLMQFAVAKVQEDAVDEQEVEKKLKQISKYYTYEYKEAHELTGMRILQYLWKEQKLQEKFNRGFKDALIMSQEIYRIDDYGGKPVVVKCDPRSVYSIRRGTSHRIEDSDIIVEIGYEPIGRVIDEFHTELTSDQVEQLEAGYERVRGGNSDGVLNHTNQPVIYSNLNWGGEIRDMMDYGDITTSYGLPFDASGNIRVTRVRWLSRKKIGNLHYFDEFGDEQVRIVPETYKPDKTLGEWVEWYWVNEAMEGTELGDDIFVKCRIRPIQMRHFDNPSMCFLGYVGTDYSESLMGRMEPYQYLYNVYMFRLELALAKYKGAIYELDLAKKPDEWEVEQWMYYAEILGYSIIDSFNEGKKGEAQGKLAGHFNTSGKVLNPSVGDYIQQIIMMLQYIEGQVSKISGITEQREGQVSNRETVGGIERAVTQSSHITEKWFFIHDETKKRVLQALLDTAKQMWSNSKSKKLSFILDDMSRVFLDFNGEDFASSEYDIFASNSAQDQEIRDIIKQLSHAAVQNGASLLLPIKILKSDSIADMTKKLEIDEQERQQREDQMQQSQQESAERIEQMRLETAQSQLELEKYKADLASNTAIEVALIRAESTNNNSQLPEADDSEYEARKLDLEQQKVSIAERKLQLEKDKTSKQLKQSDKQIDEGIRHNKATESISRNKPKSSK